MVKQSRGAALRAVDPKVVEFVEAAALGDVRVVRKLVKAAKVEIDEDVDGVTALMKACGNGHLAVVEELLGNGAGMWCAGPTDDPKTPFMWAAHHGQLDVIRYFMEEVGLDDLAMNKGAGKSGRKTAMDYALDAGSNLGEQAKDRKAQVLAYLQENGAEHGEGVTDPETVFDGAARDDVKYVHFCLEANGDIIRASHGAESSSLLHVAGNTGNIDLTRNLISHGADVEARNAYDRTPLMSAAMAGNVGVLRLLLDHDVALEHRDSSGDTALHHACEAGHLDCVRALLSRDAPTAKAGTDDGVIAAAIIEGDAPEHQPPAKRLSPVELLAMKNLRGHTPVIKAFAGGVHVSVIRYVVGVQDSNVDPIRSGGEDADPPALLTGQLSTDGIVLHPPTPPPPGAELDGSAEEKRGGMFTCGDDGALEEEQEHKEARTEELVDDAEQQRQLFLAANGLPYPVYVAPGPPSQGHRRMARFIENMRTAVWGFGPDKVYVMSRPAVMAQKKMPPFHDAKRARLLLPLSEVPPAAKVLYVSHRWAGNGQPDTDEAHAMMQLNRYLEEPAGEGIHFVWIDVSCIDVGDKDGVDYDQYMSNVVTALARSTHVLAVPPCKVLDPRTLVRDMSVSKMAEKRAAAGEKPEYLKKVPSALSINQHSYTSAADAASTHNGGGGGRFLSSSTMMPPRSSIAGTVGGKGSASADRAVALAVEQEVDAAITLRKTAQPDKWSLVHTDPAAGTVETPVDGAVTVGGGGGKAPRPPASATNGGGGAASGGGTASVGGKGGGGVAAPRSSLGVDGGGGAGGGRSSSKKVERSTSVDKRKKSSAAVSSTRKALPPRTEAGDAGVVEGGVVLTKKEKRALREQEAREDAAAAAAEVTHDVSQMPSILKDPIVYSDPTALLNRGWVEMEISLALVFGVQVLVCVRWGAKVTFQTVLVTAVISEEGDTVEQATGFRGAFLHGLARVAPDVEEAKGFVVGVKRLFGPERLADPTVPVKVTYMPMLDLCHEPETVVAPLVRASLAMHDEGALLPFLAGDLSPVDIMYRLSGLALQDVKDGFSGLGPISNERDRVTLVRLYLLGLSYAMGVVPKGESPVGKPKSQVLRDYAEAQRKITLLETQVEELQHQHAPAAQPAERETAVAPPAAGGCSCVIM